MSVPFYSIFNALCADVSLSPSKAAEIIGFNKGTVSAWKSGRTSPSNEILLKIATFFVPIRFSFVLFFFKMFKFHLKEILLFLLLCL